MLNIVEIQFGNFIEPIKNTQAAVCVFSEQKNQPLITEKNTKKYFTPRCGVRMQRPPLIDLSISELVKPRRACYNRTICTRRLLFSLFSC